MRNLVILLVLSLAGCGAAGPRMATATLPEASFDELDADRSQALDREELAPHVRALATHMDGDRDGALAASEMETGLFAVWDADRSGGIDAPELARAEVAWFPHETEASFAVWDTDASGSLDRDEHAAGLARARLVQRYDSNADGVVSESEIARVFFDSWDLDGDEHIDALEWRFDG